MQKLAILPIIGQFTCITYARMHVHIYNINIVVIGVVNYCYCVYTAVSAGYSII